MKNGIEFFTTTCLNEGNEETGRGDKNHELEMVGDNTDHGKINNKQRCAPRRRHCGEIKML